MCATFNNLAFVQHNDLVRVGDGRKTMAVTKKLLAPVHQWEKKAGIS